MANHEIEQPDADGISVCARRGSTRTSIKATSHKSSTTSKKANLQRNTAVMEETSKRVNGYLQIKTI